jgi:hypothetical protein
LDMPEDVIEHYKLRDIATPDGYVYCEIQQGMYGLPQTGIIAQELLAKRLKEHGYSQSKTTPGLWKHEWQPIIFSLVVNDFGVKYVGKEHAQHLLQMVQKYYNCLLEEEGEQYCGLTIKWDYPGKKVHLSMPLYAKNGLKCRKISRTHTSTRHMGQRCNMQRHPTTPPCLIRRGKNHSGGHRSIPFSCASSGFDNANPTQCYRIQTDGSYGKTQCKYASSF